MKVSILLSAGAFAALGAAQDMSGVSDCARGCIERMLALAPGLGCKADDVACLCRNMDFAYGVRDCTVEACGPKDLPAAAAAATEICPGGSPGASPSASPSDSQGATETPTGEPTPSPTGSARPTDSTATGSERPASTPYTTQPIVSTITSGTQVITTTVGSTTLFSPVSDTTGTTKPTGTDSQSEPTGSGTSSPTDQPNNTGTGTGTGTGAPSPTDNGAFPMLAPAAQGIMGALGVVALLAL